jgi:soluble P-type ATPase
MLVIDIPGYKRIEAEHLLLDYNGTLAIDGKLIAGVKELLEVLSKQLSIHILTADTFGTVKNEITGLTHTLEILTPGLQDQQKEKYVLSLGNNNVIAIGNGQNDMLMLRQAVLSIIILQQEGLFSRLFSYSDITCFSILDALNLLLNPLRIIATLRK